MEKLNTIKGTHDLFDEDSEIYDIIIKESEKICRSFNFQKMITPIIENSKVFQRTLGDSTDVVSKEMYSFTDTGGDSITLRPEGTAPMTRAMISNSLFERINQKFYYFGPMFRRERPQSGRLRQFHQFGVEVFNDRTFSSDAEIILVAQKIIKKLGLEGIIKLEINSLGNKKSIDEYKNCLTNYFKRFKNDLSEDSRIRLTKNVLRILDSKDKHDKKIIHDAPKIVKYLDSESRNYFDGLKQSLNDLNISFKENLNLVRGLDYYNHTIFEFVGNINSRQNALIAGGRFNGLSQTLGGRDCPGVGWAAGIDRISLIMDKQKNLSSRKIITIFASAEKNNQIVLEVLKDVSDLKGDICFHTIYNGSLKKKMIKANKLNALGTLIIGEGELKNDNLAYKDLISGNQCTVKIKKIKDFIKNKF